MQESKDIEIIEHIGPPISVEEKKAHVLPSLSHTAGTSESCMFSSPHVNRSPVDEKPNILSHGGITVNFKVERRNGDATHANSKRNHTEHDQINLIKQFLMGEDNQPPPSACQLGSTVRVDGGLIRDSPPPWANYPIDASSVIPELNFQQDNRSSAPCPPCPPQNGTQPSLHLNGYDHIPDILQDRANGLHCARPQQLDSTNHIYPFLPDMSNHVNAPVPNPYANTVHNEDISDVLVQLGMNGINTTLQNGTDGLPPYLRQEGTVVHSLQQRFSHSPNGFYHPPKEGNFHTVPQPPTQNHHAYNIMGHASATDLPGQNTNLWFGSSNTPQSNPSAQLPQVDEVLSVDDLTPSLFVDPMVPYGNTESFHNTGHFSESMHPSNVNAYPPSDMHMNQPVGQNFQTPQNMQQKRVNNAGNKSLQPGTNNSILKRMLTL